MRQDKTGQVEQLELTGMGRRHAVKPPSKRGGGHSQRETSEQIKVIAWARAHTLEYPALAWLHHIPNGGARSAREAAVLQRAGVTKGIADLFLPYPAGPHHGLYVEMKYGRNKPSPEQLEFIEYANAAGYRAVVCYGAGAAITAIEDYLCGR